MGITGNLQLGGGGGVSDIKDTYTVANSGVAITSGDSPYTVTDTGSVKVYVDSSGGAVTINPIGSPDTDDQLMVVDVAGSAGTNAITITALGSIQGDYGSIEFRYSGSAWQLLEASREYFTRNAATAKISVAEANDTLVADTFENESGSATLDDNGDFTTTGDIASASGSIGNAAITKAIAYGDFTNLGANISSDGTSHGNSTSAGTNRASGVTPTYSGSETITEANLTDGDTVTDDGWDLVETSSSSLDIDLGAAYVLNSVKLYYGSGTASDGSNPAALWGSNDPAFGTYEVLDTDWLTSAGSGQTITRGLSSATAYRYLRLNKPSFSLGGAGTATLWLNEIEVFDAAYATTLNTIRSAADAGISIAPSSTVADDEADTAITASGNVNVRISTDSASTFGAFEDYNTFLARTALINPDTGSDFVALEFQPIDGQRIKNADLVSQSAKANFGGSGVDFTVNGVKVFNVDVEGNVDFIGSATALTEGANISVDGSLGPAFTLQLDTNNITMDNPTNVRIGKKYSFKITQDDSAARTITWGSAYDFAGGTAEILTPSTNAVDVFLFESFDGTNLVCVGSYKNIS
jgi:hypothetical protein